MVEGAGPSDVDAIKASFAGLVAVAEAGNADGWLDFVTDDAIYLLPGFSPIVGAGAIRDFVKDFLADWRFSFPTWTTEEVAVSGNLAIHRYSGVATMTSRDGREAFSEDRKYLDVFRRMDDGRWRLARHMYNLNV